MARKRVRIHYRRFLRGTEPLISDHLAAALSKALRFQIDGVALNDDVALRTYEDEDYGSILLNGRFVTKANDVYGEVVRFHPDTNIPLLMKDGSSRAELEVRELEKPNNAEILKGMMFFLIRQDHVLVIEQDLSNSIFERFLRWILCEQCKVAERSGKVTLVPKLLLNDEDGHIKDVSSIELKPAPVEPNQLAFNSGRGTLASVAIDAGTNVFGLLRAAGFDTPVLERIMQREGAALELDLSISLRAGRRKVKMHGEEALAILRNVPEDDLIVTGDRVRRNRGRIEHLSDQVDIERKGNILDRSDAWQALGKAAAEYEGAGWMR